VGQPYFRQPEIEEAAFTFLQALMIPGLAEAVDAAIATYASQTRKSNRQPKKRSVGDRLKRLAELFELGDLTKNEYSRAEATFLSSAASSKRNRQAPP
jgi:hypothetical protein